MSNKLRIRERKLNDSIQKKMNATNMKKNTSNKFFNDQRNTRHKNKIPSDRKNRINQLRKNINNNNSLTNGIHNNSKINTQKLGNMSRPNMLQNKIGLLSEWNDIETDTKSSNYIKQDSEYMSSKPTYTNFTLDNETNTEDYDDDNCINWTMQIYNDTFVYGINPSVNNVNTNGYLLAQFTGPFIILTPELFLKSETTSVFYLETNDDGEILSASTLWSYNGIRENYQFGQMLFTTNNQLIILTTFIGKLIFNDGTTIDESDGNTMIGRFNLDGSYDWYLQITARSIDDIYFTLDQNNNIYICGTFTGTLRISDPDSPSITSNLESNMFIGSIDETGSTLWLKTSTGTGLNLGEGIDYNIGDNTIVAVGTFSGSITLNGFSLSTNIVANTWIAKYDLDGTVLNLISPTHPQSENDVLLDFIEAGQVTTDDDGNIYISGDMFGFFLFGENNPILADNFRVFVAKLNVNFECEWVKSLRVDIPQNSTYQPKLTVVESRNTVVLTNFGFGNTIYYTELDDQEIIDFECEGSGTLDLIISQLKSSNGDWISSNFIPGTVENVSIDIVSTGDDVYIAGSRCINSERSDGVLVNLMI